MLCWTFFIKTILTVNERGFSNICPNFPRNVEIFPNDFMDMFFKACERYYGTRKEEHFRMDLQDNLQLLKSLCLPTKYPGQDSPSNKQESSRCSSQLSSPIKTHVGNLLDVQSHRLRRNSLRIRNQNFNKSSANLLSVIKSSPSNGITK